MRLEHEIRESWINGKKLAAIGSPERTVQRIRYCGLGKRSFSALKAAYLHVQNTREWNISVYLSHEDHSISSSLT